MTSLFISYSRKDMETAKKLTEAFKGHDLDFWIDWEGIPPTVDWWKEIERGIEQANVFVFLISPDSAKSKICGQEIDHAVKNGKRLIPVVVRDIKAEESPEVLRSLNWIFLRENDNFHQTFSKLITAIKTDYEWVQVHSQLQIKALEWERNNNENGFLLHGKELQDAEVQIARNSSKEPFPTDLQREYVLRSRQSTDRQRRITTSISIGGVIALAALALFGFYQARQATSQANIALTERAKSEANLIVANTAQANAEFARATAVANEKEAKTQAKIALARQLAAQAQALDSSGNSITNIVILLAVQSMKIFPSSEAAQVLLNNDLGYDATPNVYTYNFDTDVTSVAFSPDSLYLVSGSVDGAARVWYNPHLLVSQTSYDDPVRYVAFTPDDNYVVAEGRSTIYVWETFTGKEIARMKQDTPLDAIDLSSDGKYVVSCSAFDSTIHVWETLTGREITHMTHNTVVSVAFSPDGKYIVSGGCDNIACTPGSVRVWNAYNGQEIMHEPQERLVTSVAFSPDGKYVISGSDKTVRVRETFTGKEIAHMTHEGGIASIAISPDGKYVASGSYDHTARVWEISTGVEVARMTHESHVTAVAFAPDGKHIISGSTSDSSDSRAYGSTAIVWDISTGMEVARINHGYSINSVAFSPDGKYVVSVGCDKLDQFFENGISCIEGSARQWIWQPEDLIANTCESRWKYGTTKLTLTEWKQYIGDSMSYETVCPNPPAEPEVISTPAPNENPLPVITFSPSLTP